MKKGTWEDPDHGEDHKDIFKDLDYLLRLLGQSVDEEVDLDMLPRQDNIGCADEGQPYVRIPGHLFAPGEGVPQEARKELKQHSHRYDKEKKIAEPFFEIGQKPVSPLLHPSASEREGRPMPLLSLI
jgi:hypothetical protein